MVSIDVTWGQFMAGGMCCILLFVLVMIALFAMID